MVDAPFTGARSLRWTFRCCVAPPH